LIKLDVDHDDDIHSISSMVLYSGSITFKVIEVAMVSALSFELIKNQWVN